MALDLIRLMQQLDFGPAAACIYKTLLTNGPLSPSKLSSLSRQPSKHLNQAVQALMNLQLIGKDYVREKPIYYARDPTIAWLALEADLVWATDTSLKPARLVPTTGNPREDELRAICVEIIKESQQLYKPHVAALSHRVRDANTTDELMRLTCELLFLANESIYAASKSPRLPHVAQFWTVLTGRIEKGVRYHRVADLEEIIDHGLSVVTRDMNEYNIDLRILESDRIEHSFYLVDARYLAVHHYKSASHGAGRRGVGRITNQHQIVIRYNKRFARYLSDAIPGGFVVDRLRQAGDELLSRAGTYLSSEEVEWLKDLINVGKFSKYQKTSKWDAKKIQRTEQKAIGHGFVRSNHEGFLVPEYSISEARLREVYLLSLGEIETVER